MGRTQKRIEKEELKWNVLIAIKSAEHTLNALNVERGNKNERRILNYWWNP